MTSMQAESVVVIVLVALGALAAAGALVVLRWAAGRARDRIETDDYCDTVDDFERDRRRRA